ncbi:thiamine pyrophosphate-binding protein [Nocardia tengchongensis]|uniref:thiamine pyrophosphate-binding protein n=1 Tax=Nocardia tengchongensis TaxID=2055889 RepID=UPI0036B7B921
MSDYLVRGCAELGVRHIFGVDGANIEDIYDAAATAGVHGVVAKHEFAAATMADGYARATGSMGVVVATSGGGAMNLVAGLAESFTSRVPVLALIGQPPKDLEGAGAFQDTSGLAGTIDAAQLFGAVSRYCARVDDPQDLPTQFAAAVAEALCGGPAVLLLPKNIQRSPITADPVPCGPPSVVSDPAGLSAVATVLNTARAAGQILVIAGEQVARDKARDLLRDLAVALDAAVAVTPDGRDVYGPRDPGYRGIAGMMGHPELFDAAHWAAGCLLVGTRLPATAHIPLDGIPLAGLGAQPPYLPAVSATSSNLAVSLPALTALILENPIDAPASLPVVSPRSPVADARRRLPTSDQGPGLRYRTIMDIISALLPPHSVVFADAGNTGAAAVRHLDLPIGGRFSLTLGMGGMGYSFGAAIGAAFADSRPTYVIAGDGSFFMHGMEIHTAIEHALPITFIILNNNAHAMCVIRDRLYNLNHDDRNRFRPARLAEGMAAMFRGLPCYTISEPDELRAVLSDHPASGPRFLEIDCDPDELPPFTPFLA